MKLEYINYLKQKKKKKIIKLFFAKIELYLKDNNNNIFIILKDYFNIYNILFQKIKY